MSHLYCTRCNKKMKHGFPYGSGRYRELLCGDCIRKADSGFLPRYLQRKL